MFKLFKMCLIQASLAGVLLGLGAAGCSHRNIKEEGPARPRHLLSAVTTEDHLFVVTNQNEFYRTDLNVKNFEPLSLPSVGPSILPPALYAAGPHLYLMDQHIAYSPDEGQSWKALPLPQPRRNYGPRLRRRPPQNDLSLVPLIPPPLDRYRKVMSLWRHPERRQLQPLRFNSLGKSEENLCRFAAADAVGEAQLL